MTTAPVIIASLNAIFLALTPAQRWEAAGRRFTFNIDFMTTNWFTITMVVAIILLIVAFVVVTYNRRAQERKATDRLFIDYADQRGLSSREREILLDIANNAGLKRAEAIFTMSTAFDRGAARMIEENLAQQGAEDSKRLTAELFFLREKLGFQKKQLASIDLMTTSNKLSSRQIPAGKKLSIKRRKTRNSAEIEATVVENDDVELKVQLSMPVESSPGEFWRVHYHFGASLWEFDTSVVSCNGDVLVLNHSNNVRFVNRRRFLRVPVKKPAFIARFPFVRTLVANGDKSIKSFRIYRSSTSASERAWGPPEFIPAVVTELAGPGLRIEAQMEVKGGDRVLVVFRLDEEKDRDSGLQKTNEAPASEIIEDIGVVRHTKAIQNNFSIAVELIGLSDPDLNKLIRATNAAAMETGGEGQDVPDSQNVDENLPKPATVPGE